jgi:cell division protein FtsZ
MDEVEVIQNYLLSQAGRSTDVIWGWVMISNLEDKLGITLIATGFEHKDPFAQSTPKKGARKKKDRNDARAGRRRTEKEEPETIDTGNKTL